MADLYSTLHFFAERHAGDDGRFSGNFDNFTLGGSLCLGQRGAS
jgi:hypothetical protein